MKLAIITSFPPSKVTLNEYGYHLVKNFVQKENVEQLVLVSDKTSAPKQLDFDNAHKVKVCDSWAFNSYTSIFSICRTIIKEKPDGVLLNLQFLKFGDKKIPAALGLLLPIIFKILRVNNVVLLHNILEQVDLAQAGITENKWAQKVYNFLGTQMTKALLHTDLLAVTINKYVEVLTEKYKNENIVQVPHGSFENPKDIAFDLPEGAKKVMAFGKFGTYKKVEILIEAVLKVRAKTNQNVEVVIAGTDSPNTPGYLNYVKEKYKNVAGLTFTGYVHENDVPKIFNESAVVVFPYTSTTGSSGVLHQAGSYGKAVVMPNLGDLNLLVQEEGYKGEFFEPENVNSLAAAITTILNNDEYRQSLAINNYNASKALSMEKITEMYITYFKEIEFNKKHQFNVKLERMLASFFL
jgi:glycosyltransferase involved in cell wall biosynthesis